MLKQKARVVISTYEGKDVDWGVITGMALREGLHAFQSGKKLRPIIQQYLTILFPPRTLPAPATRPSRRQLEELTSSTWEEDSSVRPTDSPPPQAAQVPTPIQAPTPSTNEELEARASSPQPKCRRLDRKKRQRIGQGHDWTNRNPDFQGTTVITIRRHGRHGPGKGYPEPR